MPDRGRRAGRVFRLGDRVFTWLALIATLLLATAAQREVHFGWDLWLARGIQRATSASGLEVLLSVVSELGSGWVPFLLAPAAGWLLWSKGRKLETAVLLGGVGLASLLNQLLKLVVARPRPGADLLPSAVSFSGLSFPSGHAVFFVTFFGFLAFLARQLWVHRAGRRLAGLGAGILILMVGLSRVHLGAHWPSDVLGGYLLGTAWLSLMTAVYRRRAGLSRQ